MYSSRTISSDGANQFVGTDLFDVCDMSLMCVTWIWWCVTVLRVTYMPNTPNTYHIHVTHIKYIFDVCDMSLMCVTCIWWCVTVSWVTYMSNTPNTYHIHVTHFKYTSHTCHTHQIHSQCDRESHSWCVYIKYTIDVKCLWCVWHVSRVTADVYAAYTVDTHRHSWHQHSWLIGCLTVYLMYTHSIYINCISTATHCNTL